MKYKLHSHRHALSVITEPQFQEDWKEFCDVIENISDEMLIAEFEKFNVDKEIASVDGKSKRKAMSISRAINALIDQGLTQKGWSRQSPIFGDSHFRDKRWTLDFAKTSRVDKSLGTFSVEVAFNNAGSMAWNLIKPVLASELNHVSKAIQTQVGIVVFATEDLKDNGCFDATVGTFELAKDYLASMHGIVVTPMILIGLEAPESFTVEEENNGRHNYGRIERK
jgi:hypothetical protein